MYQRRRSQMTESSKAKRKVTEEPKDKRRKPLEGDIRTKKESGSARQNDTAEIKEKKRQPNPIQVEEGSRERRNMVFCIS